MTQIPRERVQEIDGKYLDPAERASKVEERLGDDLIGITPWDLLCFAIEVTSATLVAMQVPEEILEHQKEISRFIYNAHYTDPEALMGEPDREEDRDAIHREKTERGIS